MWKYLLFTLLFNSGTVLYGQGNPFEIQSRIPKDQAQAAKHDTTGVENTNPFDLHAPRGASKPKTTVADLPIVNSDQNLAKKQLSITDPKVFAFVSIILLGIFFTVLIIIFNEYFTRIFRSFINGNVMYQYHRGQGTIPDLPYIIWYLFGLLSIAYLIVFVGSRYDLSITDSMWADLLILFGILSALAMMRHTMVTFLSSFLPFTNELRRYNFLLTIFNIFTGVLVFLVAILISFTPQAFSQILMYILLFAVAIIWGYQIIRGIIIGSSILGRWPLHFLLYICALEITPIILIVKVISKYSS